MYYVNCHSSLNKSFKANISVLQDCAGEKSLKSSFKKWDANFKFAAIRSLPENDPLPFPNSRLNTKKEILANLWTGLLKSECVDMQTGTLDLRGNELVGEVQLQCGLFSTQEVSYNISNTNWNCLQLPLLSNFDGFFSLGIVFVVYIPHLVVAITQREECWVFTVPVTPSPSLWELSLQQKLRRAGKETCSHSCPVMKITMNAN